MLPTIRERQRASLFSVGFCLLVVLSPALAQPLNPVRWDLTLEQTQAAAGSTILGRLEARMDPGWHLYSFSTPDGGPVRTSLMALPEGPVDTLEIYQPKSIRKLDPNFNIETETYAEKVVFLIKIHLKKEIPAGPATLSLQVRNQSCDDHQCLPPRKTLLTATLVIDPAVAAPAVSIPKDYSVVSAAAAPSGPTPGQPTAGEARTTSPPTSSAPGGLGAFLLIAFGFGLAAIFTPCVFPMIPITMSFFLNKEAQTRRESVLQAAIFCLGIVVLFSLLGLITTAILGPFGIVQIGSNIWVNSFIAVVFLIFGLSLMGAFEITIPSSILTRLDSASRTGGTLGTLLMGLTFSLTAFACVGPFVGTLLAASVQSGGIQPLLGMAAFSSGLALPFFVLALFPAYLKRLPKSGGWLVRVKVVMGFVILAAMLKYVSNVDVVMQWNLLTRERFLAAWVVLFSMAGFYLLGFLRMEGVDPDAPVTLGRLFTGIAFLIFSISLIPGIFGGRLGELDAFVPYLNDSSSIGPGSSSTPSTSGWLKNQYKEALTKARQEGKLVFVSFTGYACTNCHWMKANMFLRPDIASALRQYVVVELYTDGTDSASEENQQLQQTRFSTIAIPYYAILDPDERVVASFPGLTRDPQQFLRFLNSGLATKAASKL